MCWGKHDETNVPVKHLQISTSTLNRWLLFFGVTEQKTRVFIAFAIKSNVPQLSRSILTLILLFNNEVARISPMLLQWRFKKSFLWYWFNIDNFVESLWYIGLRSCMQLVFPKLLHHFDLHPFILTYTYIHALST